MTLGAKILRLCVLTMAKVAVKGIPVVGGGMGVFGFHLRRFLNKLVGVVTGNALLHFDGLLFFHLSVALLARNAREAVNVASRKLGAEPSFSRFRMAGRTGLVVHIFRVLMVWGEYLFAAVAGLAVPGFGRLNPLWCTHGTGRKGHKKCKGDYKDYKQCIPVCFHVHPPPLSVPPFVVPVSPSFARFGVDFPCSLLWPGEDTW